MTSAVTGTRPISILNRENGKLVMYGRMPVAGNLYHNNKHTKTLAVSGTYNSSISLRPVIPATRGRDLVDNASMLLGLAVAVYVAVKSILELFPSATNWLFASANAQTAVDTILSRSSRDPFDWLIGLVMSGVMFTSFLIAALSKDENKTKLGADSVKMTFGFLGGFLVGPK